MTVEEQLNEARALAALVRAYGRDECRRRIGEALRMPMPDADRLPMLRYDFGEVLGHPGLPAGLRLQLERFVSGDADQKGPPG